MQSVKPRLYDTTSCQTGRTTGCIVYTNIQPAQRRAVSQPLLSNRLHRVNRHSTGSTTGCIVQTGSIPVRRVSVVPVGDDTDGRVGVGKLLHDARQPERGARRDGQPHVDRQPLGGRGRRQRKSQPVCREESNHAAFIRERHQHRRRYTKDTRTNIRYDTLLNACP